MASNIDLEKPGLLADELKSRRVCCRRPLFRIFLLFVVFLLLGALIVSSMLQRVVNGNETVGFPLQSLKMGLWSEIAGNDAADVVQFDPVKRDVRLSDLEQLQEQLSSTNGRALSYPYGRNGKFAYAFYATDPEYGCAALVAIAALKRTNPREDIDILLIYRDEEGAVPDDVLEGARKLGAKLHPMAVPYSSSQEVYTHCFLKLTVFKLTQYDRILITDADSVIMKNLDHLFHLPRTPVAIPHAHWLEYPQRPVYSTSILMVIEPSMETWENRIVKKYFGEVGYMHFDMDLINDEFDKDRLNLPHQYGQLNSYVDMELGKRVYFMPSDVKRLILRVMQSRELKLPPHLKGADELFYLHPMSQVPQGGTPPELKTLEESEKALRPQVPRHQHTALHNLLVYLREKRERADKVFAESYLLHYTAHRKPWRLGAQDDLFHSLTGPVFAHLEMLFRTNQKDVCPWVKY